MLMHSALLLGRYFFPSAWIACDIGSKSRSWVLEVNKGPMENFIIGSSYMLRNTFHVS